MPPDPLASTLYTMSPHHHHQTSANESPLLGVSAYVNTNLYGVLIAGIRL